MTDHAQNIPGADSHWENLLALSAPSFAAETALPYGFSTRVIAQLREERENRELVERIGLHALFVSLTVLVLTAGVNVGLDYLERSDFDPGVRTLVQVDHIPVS